MEKQFFKEPRTTVSILSGIMAALWQQVQRELGEQNLNVGSPENPDSSVIGGQHPPSSQEAGKFCQ